MYSVGKPLAPFHKPDYFGEGGGFWSVFSNLFNTATQAAGSIYATTQQTKQVQVQAQAQIEAAKAAALANRPVVMSESSDSKNSMLLIVVAAIVVLLIIGIVIWAAVRK